MKVIDLRCDLGHAFEGWFGSEDDFLGQSGRGEIACPICGSPQINRLPSAPRIATRRGTDASHAEAVPAASPSASSAPVASSSQLTMQSQWLRAVRHVLQSTEDVGERFAEEARRIHYGEAEERGIRGKASKKDAEALHAEGIDVMSLPVPDAWKGPVQ